MKFWFRLNKSIYDVVDGRFILIIPEQQRSWRRWTTATRSRISSPSSPGTLSTLAALMPRRGVLSASPPWRSASEMCVCPRIVVIAVMRAASKNRLSTSPKIDTLLDVPLFRWAAGPPNHGSAWGYGQQCALLCVRVPLQRDQGEPGMKSKCLAVVILILWQDLIWK